MGNISNKPRILFVCGRNQWRSPTAEEIYRRDPRFDVRSAGVSPSSKQQVTEMRWASLVLVMERKYASRIRESFGHLDDLPPIRSLDISDDFVFMDPELIELLEERVEPWVLRLEQSDAGRL